MVVSGSGVPTSGVCPIPHCLQFQSKTKHNWWLSRVRTCDGLQGKCHPLTFCSDVIIAVTRWCRVLLSSGGGALASFDLCFPTPD